MDYTALIQAWNSVTQPPSGVTGQGLLPTDTTDEKVAKVNLWTVAAPKKALFTPSEILNAIVDADLAALTQLQVTQLTLMLSGSTVDASKGTSVRSTIRSLFAGKTQTLQQLGSLVSSHDNAIESWCAANNYPYINDTVGNLSVADAQNAGLV